MRITGNALSATSPCQVDLLAGPVGAGLRIFLENQTEPWWVHQVPAQALLKAERTTVIEWNGQSLRGAEHLMMALLAWPFADVDVRIWGADVPILDGSAMPWFETLTLLLGEPQGLVFRECFIHDQWSWTNGYCKVEPHSTGMHIEVTLDYLSQRLALDFEQGATNKDLLTARTFILEEDFKKALQSGLLKGAHEGNGILLRKGQGELLVLSGAPLLHPFEPVLHKMADLLGDLALMGLQLPKLSIQIQNGGHAAHHQLIARIRNALD